MSLENKQEVLTDSFIKQDILYQLKSEGHIAIDVILCAICLLFIWLFSLLSPFAWTLLVIPISLLVYSCVIRNFKTKEYRKGEYLIVTDKLLFEKQGELRTKPSFYKSKWISYLQFENSGRWEMEGTYYIWSKTYRMSDAGICHTSIQGDIFYLVLDKKANNILMAYNTRFFDYRKS